MTLMLLLKGQLVMLWCLTLFLQFLFRLTNLGMCIVKAGVGKLVEVVHGGVDQMVNFGLFQLVWVWVGDGDALLVTVSCCYVIKIRVFVS